MPIESSLGGGPSSSGMKDADSVFRTGPPPRPKTEAPKKTAAENEGGSPLIRRHTIIDRFGQKANVWTCSGESKG